MALFHTTANRLAIFGRLAEALVKRTSCQLPATESGDLVSLTAQARSHACATGFLFPRAARLEVATACRSIAAAAPAEDLSQEDENFERLSRLRRVLQGEPSAPSVPLDEQRLLRVGVMGVPNAGKSTLTNRLIGSKVSAVSPKTNTTFVPTLGGFTEGDTQILLHDTPGVVDSRHYRSPTQLRRVRSAWTTAKDCDLLLLLIDAHRQTEREDARVLRLVEELAAGKQLGEEPPATILLLNKMDKVKSHQQLQKVERLISELLQLHSFERALQISAANGSGVSELRQLLLLRAQPSRWVLDPHQKTDKPQWVLAVEIVREKIFKRLRQELPYELHIRQYEVQQRPDGSLLLKQEILVPSETVRRMVVGKNGSVVGEIGLTARLELERILQRRVHLYLGVKARSK